MTELRINRTRDNGTQTRGHLVVLRGGLVQFACLTLELPWRDNKRRVSCIPAGTYRAVRHISPKFGQSLHILDVPGRSEILIHPANYVHQLLGCIAVGQDARDLNGDGQEDITNSRATMAKLLNALGDDNEVTIIINAPAGHVG